MKVKVGDTFTHRAPHGVVNTFRREEDDPNPAFACERIRITHIACSWVANHQLYTFGAEPEWFRQRGHDTRSNETS